MIPWCSRCRSEGWPAPEGQTWCGQSYTYFPGDDHYLILVNLIILYVFYSVVFYHLVKQLPYLLFTLLLSCFVKCLHVAIPQAALGEGKKEEGSELIPLRVKINGDNFIVGSLSAENVPQVSFDLVFEKAFELSHDRKNGSVYFCGYSADNPFVYPFNCFNIGAFFCPQVIIFSVHEFFVINFWKVLLPEDVV